MTPLTARFGMSGGITAAATNPSSTIAVVGGAEGELRVINISKGEVVGILEGHKAGESVEAIEFVDWTGTAAGNASIVVTGATDGQVCVWDLTSMKLRSSMTHNVSMLRI
jgi:ribosome assembly protein SQT1